MDKHLLVADEDLVFAEEDGDTEMFYYVDEEYHQISPCFRSKAEAVEWYDETFGSKPYDGKDRRLSGRSKSGQKRRYDDVKLDAR